MAAYNAGVQVKQGAAPASTTPTDVHAAEKRGGASPGKLSHGHEACFVLGHSSDMCHFAGLGDNLLNGLRFIAYQKRSPK